MNAKTNLVGDAWLLAERISEKPIRRPDFTRALDVSFAKWMAVNDLGLNEYYHACLVADHGDGPTFAAFCRCQYDVQTEQDAEYDEYVRSGEAARDEAAEPSDAWPGEEL